MLLHPIRLACVVVSIALAGCASAPAASYGSLGTSARASQVANVARDVAGWHNSQQPDCPYVRPVSVEIIRDEGDAVVEHWTVEACESRQFTYRAYLLPGNGLTVMVSNVLPEYRAAP
jgi:hypothetical protein